MSLDAWDCAELDLMADKIGHLNKDRANSVYHAHALRQGWHGTPKWIPGRERFVARWKAARAIYRANPPDNAENPPTVFLGDWRPNL